MSVNNYAVIGNPIEHSKSPQIHSAYAKQEGVDINYYRILSEPTQFKSNVQEFIDSSGVGLNVTVPFKLEAYEACTNLNDYALAAKAVNTISFSNDHSWNGFNTDGIGLISDLKENKKIELKDKKILILGAGGATRGVLLPLLQQTPSSIVIANRTTSKAIQLVDEFIDQGPISSCGYKELGAEIFDIVINATSASLSNQLPPLPDNIVSSSSICYDLAYSDVPTAFLRWAKEHSVNNYYDGLGMLIEQAAESYYIWRGFRPDTQPVFKLLRP